MTLVSSQISTNQGTSVSLETSRRRFLTLLWPPARWVSKEVGSRRRLGAAVLSIGELGPLIQASRQRGEDRRQGRGRRQHDPDVAGRRSPFHQPARRVCQD